VENGNKNPASIKSANAPSQAKTMPRILAGKQAGMKNQQARPSLEIKLL